MATEQVVAQPSGVGSMMRRLFVGSPVAGPLVGLIVVFTLFSLFVDNFLTWRTISGIVNASALIGVVTVGVTILMIGGEFDLSVGALIAMGAYLFGQRVDNPVWALIVAVAVTALFGLINGILLVTTNIPSFIVTLGTRSIYRGVVWAFISGGTILELTEDLPVYDVLNGRFDLLNDLFSGANFRTSVIWLLLVVAIFQWLLYRTGFGNRVLATGGDLNAAEAQGVRPKRVKLAAFTISGGLAGFAGVLLFSQFQFAQVATGAGFELDAIAAAVVGGALLTGGLGSVWGALVGVLLISTLRTGVVLMDLPWIPADNFPAVVGVAIVAAVILNHYVRERAV